MPAISTAWRPAAMPLACALALFLGSQPLCAANALTPPDTTLPDSSLEERLNFLEQRLDASRTHGQVWYWSWMGIDAGSMVLLGAAAARSRHEDDQVNNGVNASLGAIGIADLLLRPLQARHGADPVRGMPEDTREEKIAKVRAAEKLLQGNAQRADDRTSLAMHTGNVGLNAAAGLIVALAGRPSDGAITFGSGTLGGIINLLSAPWRPSHDWEQYQATFAGKSASATHLDVAFTPLAGGARLGLQMTW